MITPLAQELAQDLAQEIPSKEFCCDPKKPYETRKLARQAARRTTRKVHLKTYRCPHCRFFHNGRPLGFWNSERGRRFMDSQIVLDLPQYFLT